MYVCHSKISTISNVCHAKCSLCVFANTLAQDFVVCIPRSEVHRLGSRHEDSRRDQRSPRGSGIDGIWAHDKFTEHDKLVSYPIHHQQESELTVRGEKEREGERRQEAREALGGEGKEAREIVSEKMADEPPVIDKETAEVSMDTI